MTSLGFVHSHHFDLFLWYSNRNSSMPVNTIASLSGNYFLDIPSYMFAQFHLCYWNVQMPRTETKNLVNSCLSMFMQIQTKLPEDDGGNSDWNCSDASPYSTELIKSNESPQSDLLYCWPHGSGTNENFEVRGN